MCKCFIHFSLCFCNVLRFLHPSQVKTTQYDCLYMLYHGNQAQNDVIQYIHTSLCGFFSHENVCLHQEYGWRGIVLNNNLTIYMMYLIICGSVGKKQRTYFFFYIYIISTFKVNKDEISHKIGKTYDFKWNVTHKMSRENKLLLVVCNLYLNTCECDILWCIAVV